MIFRDRLKEEISFMGFLLKEIADKAEISKRTLDSYVDSRAIMPPADTAVRIAKTLGVSVEYLVRGETATEKEIPNYKRYKKLLSTLECLSAAANENVEPFLFAAINVEKERCTVKK